MQPSPQAKPPDLDEHAIEVRPVRGRRDVERFLRVPFGIYKDDPNCWTVAPMMGGA